MPHSIRSLSSMAIIAMCGAAVRAQPPIFHVTDMATELEALFPGNTYLSSQCRALNEHGDVVGEVSLDSGSQQSWIFTFEHGIVVLPTLPGASSTQAMDLTERDANGEVIIVGGGVTSLYDYATTAAVWRFSTVTGTVLETRDVGNLPGHDEGKLLVVNNDGIALGMQGENVFQTPTKYNVHTGVLEAFPFPARPADLNNVGQVVGDRFVGDLDGSYIQMGVPPGCTSLVLTGINDRGWLVGRAGRPWTDGAGRFVANWVRHTDAGWHVPDAGSPWDTGFAMNVSGDITIGYGPGWVGGMYLVATNSSYLVDSLLPAELTGRYNSAYAYGFNDNQQIAASSGHAILLTPTGRMIIPGDVNGDVSVNHQDHCDWTTNPIDLDGDGDADADDELWLIDRLAVFGYFVEDCNGNGANDYCDIASGLSTDCNGNGVPDECEDDCDGNGIPDECESDCNGNGVPDPCDIASGSSDDCNQNGIPDECDGADTVLAGVVYDPPMWLYENIHFVDSVLITEVGTIADVDFTLHDIFRIGSVTVRLSHAGVTVTLIDRPGYPEWSGGYVSLGYDITLDDEATGPDIEAVGEYCCVFEPIVSPPSYLPSQPLSAFDGLPRQGEWTFEFIGGYPQAFDPKLFGWGISVTDTAVDPGDCCPADFTGDGTLDFFDVQEFLAAFAAQDPSSDITGDGAFDFFDVQGFLALFAAGCG